MAEINKIKIQKILLNFFLDEICRSYTLLEGGQRICTSCLYVINFPEMYSFLDLRNFI